MTQGLQKNLSNKKTAERISLNFQEKNQAIKNPG